MPGSIHIPDRLLTRLCDHAARGYPEECCGILIGDKDTKGVHVMRTVEAINIAAADRHESYQADWETLFRTVRAVRAGPKEIVGFYHSHPDGSDRPSSRDRELAWQDYSYVILKMIDGRCAAVTSWRLVDSKGGFEQESMHPSRAAGFSPREMFGKEGATNVQS